MSRLSSNDTKRIQVRRKENWDTMKPIVLRYQDGEKETFNGLEIGEGVFLYCDSIHVWIETDLPCRPLERL